MVQANTCEGKSFWQDYIWKDPKENKSVMHSRNGKFSSVPVRLNHGVRAETGIKYRVKTNEEKQMLEKERDRKALKLQAPT